jgi:hypothetical protein
MMNDESYKSLYKTIEALKESFQKIEDNKDVLTKGEIIEAYNYAISNLLGIISKLLTEVSGVT